MFQGYRKEDLPNNNLKKFCPFATFALLPHFFDEKHQYSCSYNFYSFQGTAPKLLHNHHQTVMKIYRDLIFDIWFLKKNIDFRKFVVGRVRKTQYFELQNHNFFLLNQKINNPICVNLHFVLVMIV